MNQDRQTEIEERAEEVALFFKSLVSNGVPFAEAANLSSSWMMARVMTDKLGDGDKWKDGP